MPRELLRRPTSLYRRTSHPASELHSERLGGSRNLPEQSVPGPFDSLRIQPFTLFEIVIQGGPPRIYAAANSCHACQLAPARNGCRKAIKFRRGQLSLFRLHTLRARRNSICSGAHLSS